MMVDTKSGPGGKKEERRISSTFWTYRSFFVLLASIQHRCLFSCFVFFVWVVKRLAMAMSGSSAPRLFQTFMARVIALEDMAKLSSQMLAVFQQELEPTVDNALKFLQNHVQRARAVIEELQELLEEANGIMHDDLNARLGNVAFTEGVESSETAQVGDLGQGVGVGQVSSPNIEVRQLFTSDYVTTMAAIYGMLQQDFTMQQRVVATLGLDLSSELLQNYQIMWTLRPFVDESVVEEALTWTTPFTG